MHTVFNQQTLDTENQVYRRTGGRSQENAQHHYIPAFLDGDTAEVFLSRYADGQPAPIHLLDGLPTQCVLKRDAYGLVLAVKASIVSGFCRDGQFYTRDQVAQTC